MLCRILRPFRFSRDGLAGHVAEAGQSIDLPDDIAPGLIAEGFAAHAVAPETQAFAAAPENKRRPGRPRKA